MKLRTLIIILCSLVLSCAETKKNPKDKVEDPIEESNFLPAQLSLEPEPVSEKKPLQDSDKIYFFLFHSIFFNPEMDINRHLLSRFEQPSVPETGLSEVPLSLVQQLKSKCEIKQPATEKKQTTTEIQEGTIFVSVSTAQIGGKNCPSTSFFESKSSSQVIELDPAKQKMKMTAQVGVTETTQFLKKSFYNYYGVKKKSYDRKDTAKYEYLGAVDPNKNSPYDSYTVGEGNVEIIFSNDMKLSGKFKHEELIQNSRNRSNVWQRDTVVLTLPSKNLITFVSVKKGEGGKLVLQKGYLNGYEVTLEQLEQTAKESRSWPKLPPAISTSKN